MSEDKPKKPDSKPPEKPQKPEKPTTVLLREGKDPKK